VRIEAASWRWRYDALCSAANPKFSPLEAAVLWEYLKLSNSIKRVRRRISAGKIASGW
jgi:hypothetical protein